MALADGSAGVIAVAIPTNQTTIAAPVTPVADRGPSGRRSQSQKRPTGGNKNAVATIHPFRRCQGEGSHGDVEPDGLELDVTGIHTTPFQKYARSGESGRHTQPSQ
jgi:hypothetical protein